MAVNVFKNLTANLTTTGQVIYTTPPGYTGIVLMAQLSNITSGTANASMFVRKTVDGVTTNTSLVTNFDIPARDAAGALSGKLILQSLQSANISAQSLVASAGSNSAIQLTLSILESQN